MKQYENKKIKKIIEDNKKIEENIKLDSIENTITTYNHLKLVFPDNFSNK
jgi:hypothetical protein